MKLALENVLGFIAGFHPAFIGRWGRALKQDSLAAKASVRDKSTWVRLFYAAEAQLR